MQQFDLFGDVVEVKVKPQKDTSALQDDLRREIYKLRQEKSVMLSAKKAGPQWDKVNSRIKQIEAIFRQNQWDINNYGPLFEGL